jgi:hypothetical protein
MTRHPASVAGATSAHGHDAAAVSPERLTLAPRSAKVTRMSRRWIVMVIGAAVAAAALLPAQARAGGSASATCAHRSIGSFPRQNSHDVVVGPLRFVGLRDIEQTSAASLQQHHGWKSPAIVQPGHSATVTIDRSARSSARLRYTHEDPDDDLADLPHTVRFAACGRQHVRTAFWSGFFATTTAPSCIPLSIRIDAGRVRHLHLSVGGGSCAESTH